MTIEVFQSFGEDGTEYWKDYDGKLNSKDDLPAVIRPDGTKEWYRWNMLHRGDDLPAVVYPDGSMEWLQSGSLHREGDKPASIWSNGDEKWYRWGKQHRDSGPAYINKQKGVYEYWWEGRMLRADDIDKLEKLIVDFRLRTIMTE